MIYQEIKNKREKNINELIDLWNKLLEEEKVTKK